MSYIRTYPKLIYKNDVSFFDGGFRLSSDFIKKENLQEYKSVWIYIDVDTQKLGMTFHKDIASQSVILSPSSVNTLGKTIWCAYLKDYNFVKWVMEDPDIKNRRFPVEVSNVTTMDFDNIKYEIDLSKYKGIPF